MKGMIRMKKSLFSGFSSLLAERGAAGMAAYARKLGFEGVEPSPSEGLNTVAEAEALARALADEGLCVPCFSICADLFHPDETEAVDELRHWAEIAAACGSPYFHHTLIPGLLPLNAGEPVFERVFDTVVRRAAAVADYAKTLGLVCLYEDQGFYFNGADRFGRFLAALDRDNTGVCADFGNCLFVGETAAQFIGPLSPLVRHVHVKDYLYKPGSAPFPGPSWLRTRDGGYLRDTIPGHGVVDFPGALSVLRGAGYDGFFSFEFGGPEPFDAGTREAIANLEYYDGLARHTIESHI